MTSLEFWDLIERARSAVTNVQDIPGWLAEELSKLPEPEIIEFGTHLRECIDQAYDARLWLAAVVLLGGCGDDAFWDFRGWLVAQGQKLFESALADPDSLATLAAFDGTDGYPRLERMLYVDKKAFLKRAGKDDFDTVCRYEQLLPKRTHPALKNPELLEANYEQAKKHCPRLAARFPSSLREPRAQR